MSADWKPGDLALCVRGGWIACSCGCFHDGSHAVAPGTVIQIQLLARCDDDPLVDIDDEILECGELILFGSNGSGHHTRFRKINPHTPDAEDRETIELLNRKPAEVVQ